MHLIEALGPGGAERLLYTNLKYFNREAFRHSVVTLFSREPHWLEPIRGLDIEVTDLGCRNYRDIGRGVGRLGSLLRRVRPDLIHTHLWMADIVGRIAGRLAGVPVLSSIHNMEYDPEARAGELPSLQLKRDAALFLDRWTARFGARRLIAVSEYVARSAAHLLRFPRQRIDIVYNPIDFSEFDLSEEVDREQVLRELGLPPQALILLNVGRVAPQKGLLFALRALPAIVARFPSAYFVSAGSLDDRNCVATLRAEAERLGVADHFRMLGTRRDVARLLRACTLFVFPSLHEGMGIALIEALAMGCACVASNVGPLPEFIRHGYNGWLVEPRSPQQLAEAVCLLLGDNAKREALAQAAAAAPFERFRPAQAVEHLATIYRNVIQ